MLGTLYEKAKSDPDLTNPSEIAKYILDHLPKEQYRSALEQTIPVWVQGRFVKDRFGVTTTDKVPRIETFAEDDLLADDVRPMLPKQVGGSRAERIRNEWAAHFSDRVFNGREFKVFGDFTAEDLLGASTSLRRQAEAYNGKAEWYEKVAASLPAKGRVRDLEKDPTK